MHSKIAIVDDSPAIRRAVRQCIESKTDWQVCGEAEDGDEAVALVRHVRPDVVVLDLSMPKMNGLEAARKITGVAPQTGIVLFTAHANEQLQKEAENIGILEVVSKDESHVVEHLLAVLKEMTHFASESR
jgi:DNA-binding NarL/FixJ family response regulator